MKRSLTLGLGVLLFGVVACVGDSPQQVTPADAGGTGSDGKPCFPNGTCNPGLTCIQSSQVCVNLAQDAGGDALPTDSSTDSADGGWSPDQLKPSLALWLDGAGFTAPVWNDKSGHSNNATTSQGTPTAGTVNGKPSVHFTMSSLTAMVIPMSASVSGWNTSGMLVEIVAQTGSASQSTPTLLTKETSAIGLSMWFDPAQKQARGDLGPNAQTTLPSAPVDSGKRFRMWVLYQNGILTLGVGGATIQFNGAVPPGDTAGITLGNVQSPYAQSQFDGDIAEIVAVVPPPSSVDKGALETYLQTKYVVQ
jgi:hypothetical protein